MLARLGGQEGSCSDVYALFYIFAYTEAVHRQAAAIYTYGNFQEISMALLTICVMIILNPTQFLGSSMSYLRILQNT